MKPNVHVVKHGEQWAVEHEGTSRAASLHESKERAVEVATKMAKRDQVELILHGADGQIQERSSYGNDPKSSPG